MADTPHIQRSLLSGLFWVLLLNLLIKPLWILGIEVGVQNAVGIEEYGFYFKILNLAYIFNILLDLGITNFNARNIAQHPQLIQKHLSGILSIKLLLLAFYLVVTFSVGAVMGYTSRQFYLLLWICINQFLNSLIVYLRSNFEGLLLFKWDSVISILDRVLMIVICGALLFFHRSHFPIEWFVYAQTAAYLVTLATALMVTVRRVGLRRLRVSRPFTLAILRQSAPFALLVLLMATYNRIDPVLLGWLLPEQTGDIQSGIYAGAFRLLDAMTMVGYLVSVILLPVYAKMVSKHQVDRTTSVGSITRLMFSFLMAVSVGAAVTFSFMSRPLMDLLYHEHVDSIARVFSLLILDLIPISFTYVFGTLLTANGNLRQLNLFAAVTIVINVVLNLLLIPRLQAFGSAVSSLAAQSFMAVAQCLLAVRLFHLRPSLGYLLRLLAYAAIVVLMNLAWVWGSSLMPWWLWLAAIAMGCMLVALLLRIIDVKHILAVLRER